VHRHLSSHRAAVITLDDGGKCQSENDRTDGACEACALAQPDLEEVLPDAKATNEASQPRTLSQRAPMSSSWIGPCEHAPRADRHQLR